jgi:PPOX class probable F420-dependent enzyme
MASIPTSHHDLLTGEVVLATQGPDGHPQLTAIVVRLTDGVPETALNTLRQKYRNIVRDPHVTLFRADPATPMRTIEVRADAEVIPDPGKEWSNPFAASLGFSFDDIDGPGEERVRVRFHPVKVNALPA